MLDNRGMLRPRRGRVSSLLRSMISPVIAGTASVLWVLGGAPLSAEPSHALLSPAALQEAASRSESPYPRSVTLADSLVHAGDTASALRVLRAARQDDDENAYIALALGRLLARTAPLDEAAFRQRLEAESLLDQAYGALPETAEVLLELGLLKRRQFMRVDARRILERTVEAERASVLDPAATADAHFVLARILTEEMEDFEHLVFLPAGWRRDGSVGTPEIPGSTRCPAGVEYFCFNYIQPRAFNTQLAIAPPASERATNYPPRIEAEYRAALSYLPDHNRAARGLLGLLHRQRRFEEMAEEARRFIRINPDDPYAHVFLGLAYYEDLQWEAARGAFDTGLALMSSEERAPYDDVSLLLPEEDAASYRALDAADAREYERILWAKSDPLFLIPENERLLEHVARVTYAEMAFGDPERRLPGWSSDRGQVFIRYGMPKDIWMLSMDTAPGRTGRWIFWNYRLEAPSFIFRRQLGYTRVDFDFEANTQGYLQQVSETEAATTFESRAVNSWTEMPAQIARFRGSAPGQVEVLVFTRADPADYQLFEGDSVQVGMFIFNGAYQDSAALTHSVRESESGNVLFTFELPEGVFEYSLEALAPDSRVAARRRGSIDAVPAPGTGLAASDLVLAGGLVPRVPQPAGWRDFAIGASRDLVFEAEDDIHIYLEVYGLATDTLGTAQYTVEVTLQDAERRSVAARLLRSLGDLVTGRDGELAISFVRTVEPVGGVAPEYFSVSPGEAGEGAHRLVIAITDGNTGASVTVERELGIRGGEEP